MGINGESVHLQTIVLPLSLIHSIGNSHAHMVSRDDRVIAILLGEDGGGQLELSRFADRVGGTVDLAERPVRVLVVGCLTVQGYVAGAVA